MKTTISKSDEVIDAAERSASSIGISRSELCSKAVEDLVAHHDGQRVREKLDTLYRDPASQTALDEHLATLRFLSLSVDDDG